MDTLENVPKGYSWLDFTWINPNKTIEELLEYARTTELSTSPEDILKRLKQYVETDHFVANEAAYEEVKVCINYIFDHPEIHHMLKEVNDGSYRTNRIMVGDFNSFTNYEHQRRLEALRTGNYIAPVILPSSEKDTIQLLEECIERDGVLFIMFGLLYSNKDVEDAQYEKYIENSYDNDLLVRAAR